MATRCNIHFCFEGNKDKVSANVYRHYDGDVSSVTHDLGAFFDAVEKQCQDTRFYDPQYLAAKFVVWQADEYTQDKSKPLDFLGVGIAIEDNADMEYRYHVMCCREGRPIVTFDDVANKISG